jgi:hypothetical protein
MYEEFVYLLDLCILSYQLHAQTLIWPMDPYYEELIYYAEGELTERRSKFMEAVRHKFVNPYTNEVVPLLHIYRGTGRLQAAGQGWYKNDLLEPIISDYCRIYPWRPSFTRPRKNKEPWILYSTPKIITDRIDQVRMIRYSQARGPNHPQGPLIDGGGVQPPIHAQRPANVITPTAATDWLYCFEGGTGAIEGADGDRKYPLWSMMGFVLARRTLDNHNNLLFYDLYIVFRGSRSGALRPEQAGVHEQGAPDWVTDFDSMGTKQISAREISLSGKLNRGFATSFKTMLPTIMTCLTDIHTRAQQAPRNIYVTGHSLGGALACNFTSAIKLGLYQPNIANTQLPQLLINWPWAGMKLVTFGSPTVGNKDFCQSFNMAIQNSLRIYLTADFIVTGGVNHVGFGYGILAAKLPTTGHDPRIIRRYLIEDLIKRKGQPALANVPAHTGEKELNEPWKTFHSCEEVLNHLGAIQQNITDCLVGFSAELETYLTLLQNICNATGRNQAGQDLQNIINNIRGNGFNTGQALERTLGILQEPLKAIGNQLGEDTRQFIGICIIFAFISRNNILTTGHIPLKANVRYVKSFLEPKY